jgi:Icc-related predicted phosphoesterase
MKIVALTDIHAGYDLAEKILRTEIPDVCVIGGDLTNVGSVKEAEGALERFRPLCKHLLCVAGNMDLPVHDELFVRNGESINGRGVVIDGVGFFGVSAAPISPLHTPYEITEEEIAELIAAGYKDVAKCKRKIFVPHAPPYGTRVDIIHTGLHVGSTAVRDFIEEHEPDVVICGHIHEARGQDKIEETKIVNCGMAKGGNYAVIEVGKDVEVYNKHLPL